MPGIHMTNRLLGSDLSDRPFSLVSAKLTIAGHVTNSVAGSRITQSSESCLQALRVTTHGQQVVSLGVCVCVCVGGFTSLQRYSRRILLPQLTERIF